MHQHLKGSSLRRVTPGHSCHSSTYFKGCLPLVSVLYVQYIKLLSSQLSTQARLLLVYVYYCTARLPLVCGNCGMFATCASIYYSMPGVNGTCHLYLYTTVCFPLVYVYCNMFVTCIRILYTSRSATV
jgi:hypothetical protein